MGRKAAKILLTAAAACGWVNSALAGGGISVATWTNTSAGNWNDGVNWSSNPLVPNNALGVGWTALLTSTADATLDVDVVLDHLDTFGRLNTNGRSLTVNNTLEWSGGAVVGTGTINLSGVTNLNGDAKSISQVTINAGSFSTTNWTAGGIGPVDDEGGTFNNAGLFLDSTDASWVWFAQTPIFNNSGTYRKSAGSAGSNKEVEAIFNNTGHVDVQTSDLWLSGGGLSSGSFSVAAGARLLLSDFSENFSAGGAIDTKLAGTSSVFSNGEVVFSNLFGNARTEVAGDFDSAVLTVDPGPLGEVTFRSGSSVNQTITGDLNMRAGRLTFNTLQSNGVTFDQIDLTGGQIEGGDEVAAVGAMTWTGGTIRGASTQAFTAFGGLTISGENPKSLIDRAFYSTNNATSSGGNMQFDSADMINSPGANWDVTDDMDFVDLGGTFVGRFYNDGTFTKSGGTAATTFDRVEFNNNGIAHVDAATLHLAGGGSSSGTFDLSAVGTLRLGGELQHFLGSSAKIVGPIGARLLVTDSAQVDNAGSINIGVFELRDFASIHVTGGGDATTTVLAPAASDSVNMTIAGGGSWTAGSFVQIGANGIANVEIQAGGRLSGTFVDLGVFSTTSSGHVSVNGVGARLESASLLRVGFAGTASVAAGGGAVIDSDQQVLIGEAPGSNGSITLIGNNTRLDSGAFIEVGREGIGKVDVQSGARIANNGIVIVGTAAGSNGQVSVDGAGARWDAEQQLGAGNDGTGVVGIFNGGVFAAKKATSGTSSAVIIGRRGSGVGTISVSGANSKLDAVDGHLVVGFGSLTSADTLGGRGNLFLFNGGAAHSVNGYIARNNGSVGSVNIGANSRWDMDGSLYVGGNDTSPGGGVGRLFNNGGTVIAPVSTNVINVGAIFSPTGTFQTGTMNLTGGGQFNMAAGPVGVSTTLKVTALNIDTPTLSQLDLADNRLIIDYTGASPIATIRGYIQQGFNNGQWNGNRGILSNDAAIASTSSTRTGIGYVEATNIFTTFPASFGGYSIDNTTLLARYTIVGDANLDLTVNISDFSRLAANFNLAGPWFNGDFNYDGLINISDFALLAANFNKTLPSDLPRQSIPEPSAVVSALSAAVALQRRCRRRVR